MFFTIFVAKSYFSFAPLISSYTLQFFDADAKECTYYYFGKSLFLGFRSNSLQRCIRTQNFISSYVIFNRAACMLKSCETHNNIIFVNSVAYHDSPMTFVTSVLVHIGVCVIR